MRNTFFLINAIKKIHEKFILLKKTCNSHILRDTDHFIRLVWGTYSLFKVIFLFKETFHLRELHIRKVFIRIEKPPSSHMLYDDEINESLKGRKESKEHVMWRIKF